MNETRRDKRVIVWIFVSGFPSVPSPVSVVLTVLKRGWCIFLPIPLSFMRWFVYLLSFSTSSSSYSTSIHHCVIKEIVVTLQRGGG